VYISASFSAVFSVSLPGHVQVRVDGQVRVAVVVLAALLVELEK
jgi:hypothetical protein